MRRNPRMATSVVAGGSVVLLAVAIGLGFAVFRDAVVTADASAGPSVSATESASPTLDASPSSTPPGPTPSVIPYAAGDPLMQVKVSGLRMRASPSTNGDIIRSLDRGEVVRLRGGAPVNADGYAWHEVVDLDSRIGWVAMGSDVGGPWLEAVPAEPATSGLLLRYQRNCDANPREPGGIPIWPPDLTLTADGRIVVWSGGGRLGTTGTYRLAVRQLSPSGLAQFQREVLDLPALQESGNYVLERMPNSPDPPGHGACIGYFTLGEGTARVEVSAVAWQGSEEGVYWVPSPERRALDELAIHLEEVEVWLGAAAWSEPVARRYVSSSYLFWLEPPSDTSPSGVNAPLVTGTAWPFAGPIEQFGEPVGQARCGYLDLSQAFEVLRLMRSLGVDPGESTNPELDLKLDGFGFGNFTTDAGWFGFYVTPRGPDGYPSCPD